MSKILIADDDKDIRNLLKILLGEYGEIIEAENGQEAVALCSEEVHLILLDVMMPKLDGFGACMEIRKSSNAPVLFLTAKGQEYDKLVGFSAGGDDYIVKPFVPSELQARVKALLRRFFEYGSRPRKKEITLGSLTINEDTCSVAVHGVEKSLTATEYKILLLLCKTKGKVYSAQNIYESIWNEPYFYSANNTVMVHIRKLREKLEPDPRQPRYIKTLWGMGYKIDVE